jgi:hypothetical protein
VFFVPLWFILVAALLRCDLCGEAVVAARLHCVLKNSTGGKASETFCQINKRRLKRKAGGGQWAALR